MNVKFLKNIVLSEPFKARLLQGRTRLRSFMGDYVMVALHIWHMAVVKKHYRAAWTMLRLYRTLVRHRREKTPSNAISPFVYVMQ